MALPSRRAGRAPRGRCARSRASRRAARARWSARRCCARRPRRAGCVRPSNAASRCARLRSSCCWSGGSVDFDAVQEQRHLVEQPLRRARALDDDRARVAAQPLLVRRASARGPCRRSPAGTRTAARAAIFSSSSKPLASGSAGPSPCSRSVSVGELRERLGDRAGGDDCDVVAGEQHGRCSARSVGSSSTISTVAAFACTAVLQRLDRVVSCSRVAGFSA